MTSVKLGKQNKDGKKVKLALEDRRRFRLSVYRSNKYIYAQIIDDREGKTLVSASEKDLVLQGKTKHAKLSKESKIAKAKLVGEKLAEKAKIKKITKVVFDRGNCRYHGRVKALAEGARKGGLVF
jgi:large subunit ribosomal protein L18